MDLDALDLCERGNRFAFGDRAAAAMPRCRLVVELGAGEQPLIRAEQRGNCACMRAYGARDRREPLPETPARRND